MGFLRYLPGTPGNLILSGYPRSMAVANEDIDENGLPTTDFVILGCKAGVCAYYQYIEGTSVAAPHAAWVAALIVSQSATATSAGVTGGSPSRPGRPVDPRASGH